MTQQVLHTIGYEGSSIEAFVATLSFVRIDLLIDIRDVPVSRKSGFSKNALAGRLAASDIDYLHLKGLGDPKSGREAARKGRYNEFRQIFSEHLRSEIAQADVGRGIQAALSQSACLLCFERDYSQCHRRLVADEMALRGKFRIVHLGVQEGLIKPKGIAARHAHDRTISLVG
jgi:uncharacterized protein (DUF488 family)